MTSKTEIDKIVLDLLKKGYNQQEIAKHFQKHDHLSINALSSVEKVIQRLKKQNNVKTLFQLGMMAERMKD